MEGCLDHLAEQASGFIANAAKKDAPFLLYFPLTAPHKPVWPAKRFQGTTELGSYGDFVAQVDWTVGSVLKAIDDAGVRDNTIVI
jgi:arylsulfatase A